VFCKDNILDEEDVDSYRVRGREGGGGYLKCVENKNGRKGHTEINYFLKIKILFDFTSFLFSISIQMSK